MPNNEIPLFIQNIAYSILYQKKNRDEAQKKCQKEDFLDDVLSYLWDKHQEIKELSDYLSSCFPGDERDVVIQHFRASYETDKKTRKVQSTGQHAFMLGVIKDAIERDLTQCLQNLEQASILPKSEVDVPGDTLPRGAPQGAKEWCQACHELLEEARAADYQQLFAKSDSIAKNIKLLHEQIRSAVSLDILNQKSPSAQVKRFHYYCKCLEEAINLKDGEIVLAVASALNDIYQSFEEDKQPVISSELAKEWVTFLGKTPKPAQRLKKIRDAQLIVPEMVFAEMAEFCPAIHSYDLFGARFRETIDAAKGIVPNVSSGARRLQQSFRSIPVEHDFLSNLRYSRLPDNTKVTKNRIESFLKLPAKQIWINHNGKLIKGKKALNFLHERVGLIYEEKITKSEDSNGKEALLEQKKTLLELIEQKQKILKYSKLGREVGIRKVFKRLCHPENYGKRRPDFYLAVMKEIDPTLFTEQARSFSFNELAMELCYRHRYPSKKLFYAEFETENIRNLLRPISQARYLDLENIPPAKVLMKQLEMIELIEKYEGANGCPKRQHGLRKALKKYTKLEQSEKLRQRVEVILSDGNKSAQQTPSMIFHHRRQPSDSQFFPTEDSDDEELLLPPSDRANSIDLPLDLIKISQILNKLEFSENPKQIIKLFFKHLDKEYARSKEIVEFDPDLLRAAIFNFYKNETNNLLSGSMQTKAWSLIDQQVEKRAHKKGGYLEVPNSYRPSPRTSK